MGGRGGSSASAKAQAGGTVYESALRSARSVAAAEINNLHGGISDQIPQWILDRESRGIRRDFVVKRETEKAILVSSAGDMAKGIRDTSFWVPKSQLQSVEKTKQEILERAANKIVSMKYSNYLKDTAAGAGVKVGNLGSWEKITAKLRSNGVAVMSRDEFKDSKA